MDDGKEGDVDNGGEVDVRGKNPGGRFHSPPSVGENGLGLPRKYFAARSLNAD